MTDYTELKRMAEAVKKSYADLCEHGGDELAEVWNSAELAYDDARLLEGMPFDRARLLQPPRLGQIGLCRQSREGGDGQGTAGGRTLELDRLGCKLGVHQLQPGATKGCFLWVGKGTAMVIG
mgnify:CR=1 FL=1